MQLKYKYTTSTRQVQDKYYYYCNYYYYNLKCDDIMLQILKSDDIITIWKLTILLQFEIWRSCNLTIFCGLEVKKKEN